MITAGVVVLLPLLLGIVIGIAIGTTRIRARQRARRLEAQFWQARHNVRVAAIEAAFDRGQR